MSKVKIGIAFVLIASSIFWLTQKNREFQRQPVAQLQIFEAEPPQAGQTETSEVVKDGGRDPAPSLINPKTKKWPSQFQSKWNGKSKLSPSHFTELELNEINELTTFSQRHVDSSKARKIFQSSLYDSQANYQISLAILKDKYTENRINDSFLKNRIMALNFLKYTKHLELEGCKKIFKSILSEYNRKLSLAYKKVIDLDLRILKEACYREHSQFLSTWIKEQNLANHLEKFFAENVLDNSGLKGTIE